MKKNFFKKTFLSIFLSCMLFANFSTIIAPAQAIDTALFDTASNSNKYEQVYRRAACDDKSGGSCVKVSGALALRDLIIEIVMSVRWVVMVLAVLFIVVSGTKMVTGGNEENSKKQLKVIRDVVIGIIIMNLAYFIVGNIFGIVTETTTNGIVQGTITPVNLSEVSSTFAPIIVAEKVIYPLVDFFLSFLAAFTVLFLIISAFRIITAQGQEEKIKDAFKILLNTTIGLALIILARVFVKSVFGDFSTSAKPALNDGLIMLMNIASYILGFFVFIGVIMYIYAGVLVFFGGVSEPQKKKGMSIALYTTIGILVAIISYTFIAAVIRLVP